MSNIKKDIDRSIVSHMIKDVDDLTIFNVICRRQETFEMTSYFVNM